MTGDCEICGEAYDQASPYPSLADVGEFVDEAGEHVIAHAECGLGAGLELA